MADQRAPQTKKIEGEPSNAKAKFMVGRFGNLNLDDELDGVTQKKNAEEIIGDLMEKKKEEDKNRQLDLDPYIQLWKAMCREDWKEVKKELDRNKDALTSPISGFYETVLHILVNWEKALWVVREIVGKVDPVSLGKTDYQDDTALSIAAYAGNTEAARMMASKKPDLLMISNCSGDSPFHAAARFGHEETFRCLLTVARETQMDDRSFFAGTKGASIIQCLISANLHGLALDMLRYYPNLCRENRRQRRRILNELAEKPSEFESGRQFKLWEHLIYKAISVTKQVTVPSIQSKNDCCLRIDSCDRGGGNPTSEANFFAKCSQKAFSIIGLIVPSIKRIHEIKLKNEQARQLVKTMCSGAYGWTFLQESEAFKLPVLKAASLGIEEIVEEILKEHPSATMFYDENNYNIFQLAVLYRREKVIKLIHKMGLRQKWIASYPCKDKENVLHLAGKCTSSWHINGAALQMQSEMQWFKAVEKFVHPLLLEERNEKNRTPGEVFSDEHKELLKAGGKWLRDTATSCMVVDALVIAMVFAAIIAVPGNNEKGIPNFRRETLFKVFVIADATALFSSSHSLLLFVGILTSRFAEEDFLKALPKKLLLGLITLIFSIATMLVASSSALIMLIDAVPGPKVMLRESTIIPVTVLAALPVIFFIWSQSHLLIDVFLSTYRPTIL